MPPLPRKKLKKAASKKGGTMPIMAIITVSHFSTKLSIQPENWDTWSNRMKGRDRDAKMFICEQR
ncbi:MAG: Arm DNA-binding domain-containing protein [Proteiniphilum sp.]|nr:Arm DNA-binding domain-containing protein [Proteiniphilum sp.]MDD4415653.1 Arm DNA-binding domain-containing protein [Proteiniphilum sp.]